MVYDRRNAQGSTHLSAYDPAGGKVTATRSFPRTDRLPINGNFSGYILRQQFNSDFSAMTAQGPREADGSRSAGITDPSGLYQPLTAATSGGYGSPAVKWPLAFNPATGRLWYTYGDGAATAGNRLGSSLVGSVDPQVGASSERREVLVPETSHDNNGPFSFPAGNGALGYFAADGFGPIDVTFGIPDLFLAGGTDVSKGVGGFQIGKEGTLDHTKAPILPATTSVGDPKLPVSNNSFVAFDDSPDATTQLYLCTIGKSQITTKPLLPPSNRVIQDVALDPTGTKLAFVSTAGDLNTLYIVDLTGTNRLSTLGEVAVPSGSTVQVLAWH